MTDTAELDLTPPTAEVKPKKTKKEKTNGEAKPEVVTKEAKPTNRAKLSKTYPEDAKLTVLVDANPKKAGSAAAAIFEFYKDAKTVGDFFAATAEFTFKDKKRPGTYADITYDVGHGYIKVG